jgi:hypothetical protein
MRAVAALRSPDALQQTCRIASAGDRDEKSRSSFLRREARRSAARSGSLRFVVSSAVALAASADEASIDLSCPPSAWLLTSPT